MIAQLVGPEDVVEICWERSLSLIIAIIGVLKAGAAYLPIDPAYPLDRLMFMVDDVRPAQIVTETQFTARLPKNERFILLDEWMKAECAGQADTRTPSDQDRTRRLQS